MRRLFHYIVNPLRLIPKSSWLAAGAVTAVATAINYSVGLSNFLSSLPFPLRWAYWTGILCLLFGGGYYIIRRQLRFDSQPRPTLILFIVLASALFALKMSMRFYFGITGQPQWDDYLSRILTYPVKGFVLLGVLWMIWRRWDRLQQPFYGIKTGGHSLRPYWIMLAIMVPLIAWASTQADFLAMYPKLKLHFLPEGPLRPLWALLYELSYGFDFVGIEVFFRGFLVLAFLRWAGTAAVLPMAMMYCGIHFGKPLGECISSFFGGLILGSVTAQTGSVWGGLMVHLGIAWLMELGGYLGKLWM